MDFHNRKRVLIALSGGIDSAVSAYLLIKKGYYVEAAFMKNWTSQEGLLKNECPWLSDRRDALRVAAFLGIKIHTLDFEKEYQKKVMRYFFEEYKKGCTPNPDVMCNKEIKFKLLYDWSRHHKFDYLATGHYARSEATMPRRGRRHSTGAQIQYRLLRSADEFKDQTYFIYNIKPSQLPHLLFPVGSMKKTAVRALARKIGLPNAEKKESMGLCFVGKIRLKDFLEQKLKGKRGVVIDQNGQAIGYHQGLYNYTIGQRQGIKIGSGGPYYVFGKDLKRNRLYVTNDSNDQRLLTREVELHSVNWVGESYKLKATSYPSVSSSGSRDKLLGRYRHQGELVPLTISKLDRDHYRVAFKHSQKAVASGQSLVLYKDKQCLGGGIIV